MWRVALADYEGRGGAEAPEAPLGAAGGDVSAPHAEEGVLVYADLSMDLAAMKVRRSGAYVHLAPTEFRMLRHFLRHPERAFTRDQLVQVIHGGGEDFDRRNVDAHIVRLRRALNRCGRRDLIRTIRRFGYSLDEACS
jgi:two-component system phosphate regulon response regulator PhoB